MKKLYGFLADEGIVGREVCDEVCATIKEEAPYWADACDPW